MTQIYNGVRRNDKTNLIHIGLNMAYIASVVALSYQLVDKSIMT